VQPAALDGHVVGIHRASLTPGPWQPRRVFDPESLDELATSIRARGILSPLRVVPDPEHGRYLIVAGERRWRAAALAGLAEVPCVVMSAAIGSGALQELAILDNLHRANLRPGEEARAVQQLQQLGLILREMALRLGKSQGWVSQRLAIARLPESALEQLDDGSLTRQEALGLATFADEPDLIDACLEPDGRRLRQRLGGHVPETVGERVQAIRRVLELRRQRDDWAAGMRAGGHSVLDETPSEGDRRYAKLLQGSEASRAHQQSGLSCVVWAWDRAQPVRYCDRPRVLRTALKDISAFDPAEQARHAEHQRTLAKEALRDATLRAWLATSRGVEMRELTILARERITTLSLIDDRLLGMLGGWLGASGDRTKAAAVAEQELSGASETRLVQLWFLLEAAHTMASAVVPPWLVPWLARLGFVDPQGPSDGANDVRQAKRSSHVAPG